MVGFIRFGNDFNQKFFYQIEIPLKVTVPLVAIIQIVGL
jgi:hypothetical protein